MGFALCLQFFSFSLTHLLKQEFPLDTNKFSTKIQQKYIPDLHGDFFVSWPDLGLEIILGDFLAKILSRAISAPNPSGKSARSIKYIPVPVGNFGGILVPTRNLGGISGAILQW